VNRARAAKLLPQALRLVGHERREQDGLPREPANERRQALLELRATSGSLATATATSPACTRSRARSCVRRPRDRRAATNPANRSLQRDTRRRPASPRLSASGAATDGTMAEQYFSTIAVARLARLPSALARSLV
jgi:hypothetical protein